MKIKFWGVRGSIPCPGPSTVRYGGNTACIELRLPDSDRLIIIDAGSGIRELGNQLIQVQSVNQAIEADIFLTHTHWDHIMGFPFFAPVYMPNTRLCVHGPVTYEEDTIKEVLSVQWTYRYFPIRQEELASRIKYVDLREGAYEMGGGLVVHTKYLNHPLLCLGYRFEYGGKRFCTVYDTEPFANVFITNPRDPGYDAVMAAEGEDAARMENQRIEAFVRDSDLVVYDTQYTQEEFNNGRKGWGHSPIEHAVRVATENNVKRLALFHHDIHRSDAQLDQLAEKYCTMSATGGGPDIFFAREGQQITI